MTYVLVTCGASTPSSLSTLWEVKSKADRLHLTRFPDTEIKNVSGAEAHRWVKRGNRHTTPLYIDYDGRVRYAHP